MRRLTFTQTLGTVVIALLFHLNSVAQEATVTIEQDEKLETIMKERKRLLKKGELRTHYTIQVFSGEIENAQKVLKECKSKFKDHKSQIFYETPNYKVWVGKYRNRLDADRALLLIHEDYPGAFAFKPDNKKGNK